MGIEDSYNFRRIDDGVTTSGVVGAKRLSGLAGEGYGAVINLLPDDSEWAVEDEQAIVEGQGLEYVYIPVDWDAPTTADLDAFSAAMARVGERRVHVHCAANFRVTAFYGLHAQRSGEWSTEQAAALVADVWSPADHPQWETFIAQNLAT